MENKPRKILTLCIIHQHPRVLLGMKKKGFGFGKWNGFGGKVEEGESVEVAARREVIEEAGIEPIDIEKRGVVAFDFKDGSRSVEVHIFSCSEFSGEPTESEEMRPQWFSMDEIPFKDMWTADTYWLPMFFQGKRFKGKFLYDMPTTPDTIANVLEKSVEEVDEI